MLNTLQKCLSMGQNFQILLPFVNQSPFSTHASIYIIINFGRWQINWHKMILPGRESNPGRPRDRREYSPLYYRGLTIDICCSTATWQMLLFSVVTHFNTFRLKSNKIWTYRNDIWRQSVFRVFDKILPGRESNPGRPRDRREYSPLYYQGNWAFSLIKN